MCALNRREFIYRTTVVGACALCGLGGCATLSGKSSTPAIDPAAYQLSANGELQIDLGHVPQLAVVGGSVKLTDDRLAEPLIIARTSEADYVVSTIKCTHRGVEVEYRPKEMDFKCASVGGSSYRLDGTNTGGPARKPLRIFGHRTQATTLIVQTA